MESYHYKEMQIAYSIAPADWAKFGSNPYILPVFVQGFSVPNHLGQTQAKLTFISSLPNHLIV